MMKRLIYKAILSSSLIIGISSCTEEISEDIQNQEKLASSSSSSSGSSTTSTSKKMWLTNEISDLYSHFLHEKSSEDEGCELVVNDPENLEASDYSYSDVNLNVDCILDAGEFDLYYQGAEFKINVDAGLCENLEYRPFKFFQYQPGDTNKTIYKVQCDSICGASENTTIQQICSQNENTYDDLGTLSTVNPFNNGDTFNSTFPVSNQVSYDDVGDLCEFNHTNRNTSSPNCDEGQINIITYTLTGVENDSSATAGGTCSLTNRTNRTDCESAGVWNGGTETCSIAAETSQSTCEDTGIWTYPSTCGDIAGATSATFIQEATVSENDCGGAHKSCLAGAGLSELSDPKFSAKINHIQEGEDFSKDITMNAPDDDGYLTNMSIANYSRVCSSVDTTDTITKNAAYYTSSPQFIPSEHETVNINNPFTSTTIDETKILAEQPFKGLFNFNTAGPDIPQSLVSSRAATIPFYSFRCLDHAGDVKAQIRLYIRDWDKSFINETRTAFDFTQVTDVHLASPNNYMDAHDEDGPTNRWNDVRDWDDFWNDQDATPGNWIFTKNSCFLLNNEPTNDFNCTTGQTTEAACLLAGGDWTFRPLSRNNFPGDNL